MLTFSHRMQEADMGFVMVVDRRNDKWSSVKTTLLKISVSIASLADVVVVTHDISKYS